MATIKIPAQLLVAQNLRQEAKIETIEIDGSTIGEIINKLGKQYPGVKDRICYPGGKISKFVNIFADGDDINFRDNKDTRVETNSEVVIVPVPGYFSGI